MLHYITEITIVLHYINWNQNSSLQGADTIIVLKGTQDYSKIVVLKDQSCQTDNPQDFQQDGAKFAPLWAFILVSQEDAKSHCFPKEKSFSTENLQGFPPFWLSQPV